MVGPRVRRRWWAMAGVGLLALALVTVASAGRDGTRVEALPGDDGGGGVVDNPPAPAAGTRCRVAIMLDRSGSIGNPNYGGSADYVNAMKFAAAVLVNTLAGQPVDLRIGVFATRAEWLTFGGDTMGWSAMDAFAPGSDEVRFINALIAGTPWATNTWTPPGGANTNWEAAIYHGADVTGDRANVLLLVTDGEPTVVGYPASDNVPAGGAAALAAARRAADDVQRPFLAFGGTRILGLGMGSGVNDASFASITSSFDGTTVDRAYVNGIAFHALLASMTDMVGTSCSGLPDLTTQNPGQIVLDSIAMDPPRPFPGQVVQVTYTISNPSSVAISGIALEPRIGLAGVPLASLAGPFGPGADPLGPGATTQVTWTTTFTDPGPATLSARVCYAAPVVDPSTPGYDPVSGRPCDEASQGYDVRPFQYLPT